MKFTFDQIKEEHEKLKAEGSPLGQFSLADYSDFMQQQNPDWDLSAGKSPDNMAGSISRGIDSVFEATGLPGVTSAVGGAIGSGVDLMAGSGDKFQKVGEAVGKDLPRGALQAGLVAGGVAITGASFGLAAPLGGAMIGVGVADAGIKGYESSGGSVKQGLTDAVLTAAIPGVGKLGAGIGMKLVPKALAGSASAKALGAGIGAEAALVASDMAGQAFNDQDPFSAENIFGNLLGSVAELPTIIKNTRGAFKEQRALNQYRDAKFEVIPMFSTAKDVKGDGSPSQFVYDKNDIHQLKRWLVGEVDASFPEGFRGTNIERSLQLTGLVDPMGEKADLELVMARREKGKELFAQAADPMTHKDDLPSLARKVSKLLETPPTETTDLLLRVRALNEFRTKINRQAEGSFPIIPFERTASEALAGEIGSTSRIRDAFAQNQPMFPLAIRQEGVDAPARFVEALDQSRRNPELTETGALPIDTTLSQQNIMGRAVAPPGRPAAVKGKTRSIVPEPTPPSPQEIFERTSQGPARPQAVKGKARSIVPPVQPPPLTPQTINLRIQQQATGEGGPTVKGKVSPDPLAKYIAPELALVEPTGADQDGNYTVDSLGQELTRLAELEGDVQTATERLAQKVDNSLRRHVEAVTVGVSDSPEAMMSAAFDNAGLTPEVKAAYMGAVGRLRNVFGQDLADVRFGETNEQFAGMKRAAVDGSAIPAGGEFYYNLAPFDGSKIGKHTVPKSGLVDEATFLKVAKGGDQPLKKYELELYKQLVPKAFADGRVNLFILQSGLREAQPVVRVDNYGQKTLPARAQKVVREFDEMMHNWMEKLTTKQIAEVGGFVYNMHQPNQQELFKQSLHQLGFSKKDFEQLDKYARLYFRRDVALNDSSVLVSKLQQFGYDTEFYGNTYEEDFEVVRFMDEKGQTVDVEDMAELPAYIADELLTRQPGVDADHLRATDFYESISPFDTTKYPIERIDVSIPVPEPTRQEIEEFNNSRSPSKQLADKVTREPMWEPDKIHENLPNTLGWAMVQIVPDPKTGENVMFVAEQQSRWGQTIRKQKESLNNKDFSSFQDYREAKQNIDNQPPLLDVQHELVLKAVINEAQKRGITKIAISDGETALMTELLDSADTESDYGVPVENNWRQIAIDQGYTIFADPQFPQAKNRFALYDKEDDVVATVEKVDDTWYLETPNSDILRFFKPESTEPRQAKGMRLHYDNTLPSAMKKLTGDRGTRQSFGQHKNAIRESNKYSNQRFTSEAEAKEYAANHLVNGTVTSRDGVNWWARGVERAYSTLKNPDGTPKSEATAVVYNVPPKSGEMRLAKVDQPAAAEILRGAYFGDQRLVSVASNTPRGEGAMAAYDSLVTLAHESMHALLHKIDLNKVKGADRARAEAVKQAREYADQLSPEDRALVLRRAHETLVPKAMRKKQGQDSNIDAWAKYASKNTDEFLTEYGAIVALSKSSPASKMTFMRSLPEPLANFLRAVFRGIHELRQALFASGEIQKFKGGLKEFKEFHYNVEGLFKPDPVIEKAKSVVRSSVEQLQAMEAGDVGGNTVKFAAVPASPALTEHVQQVNQIKQSNGFVRNVLQHQQMSASAFYKKEIPAYQATVSALTTMDGLAVTLQHEMRSDFMVAVNGGLLHDLNGVLDSKLTPEQIAKRDVFREVENTPKLQNALHEAMRLTNEVTHRRSQLGELPPTFADPEVAAAYKDLTPEEVGKVEQLYNAYAQLSKKAGQLQIRAADEKLVYIYADYILGSGVPHTQAMQMARQLRSAQLTGQPLPPALAQNQGVQGALEHWAKVELAYSEYVNSFDRPYFTEFRSGRYGVRYQVLQPDGTYLSGYRSTNDKLQRKAIIRELQQDPAVTLTDVDIDHFRDKTDQFGHMKEAGLDKAIRLVRSHYQAAMDNGNSALAALLQESEFDPAQPLVDTKRANLKTQAERTFAPGREKVNMTAAQDAYSSLIARKIAADMTRLETAWQMKHEDWSKDKALQEEVKKFRHGVLTGGRQEMVGFRKATTFMTMGANVSSALVDSTQMVTMGMWRATQEVGFGKALAYTAGAYKAAFAPIDKIKDADFREILVMATNQGLLKTGGTLDNFIDPNDAINYNVLRASDNRDMVDMKGLVTDREFLAHRVFEKISEFSEKAFDYGMTPTKVSAQINNKGALYVGYRIGKDKGLTGGDLYRFAVQHMQVTNLQGSRAAHSSFKLKAGEGNKYVEAATLMTNYPIAMFSQLYSTFKDSLKSSGLDAQTRRRSQQAFAGQLLVQMSFAGIGGLGLNAVFKIAEEWFGVDVENEVRGSLKAIDESGTLGEVLLNGVMNQVTGYDLASRFDLTGIAGFNSRTGFDAKGLFGAGGGTISALYNAPSQFAKGDLGKIQLIPAGIRNLIASDSKFKEADGQTLIEPTAAESFASVLGLRSTRLTKAYQEQNLAKKTSIRVSEEKARRKAELATLMNSGDFQTVIDRLNLEVQQDMLDEGLTEGSRQELAKTKQKLLNRKLLELVDYTVNKEMPLDPLRQGSGEAGRAVREAMENRGAAVNLERSSEEQRTMAKIELMRKLTGKVPPGAPAAVKMAKYVDAVLQQYPTMTVSEAKKMAEQMMKR